MSLASPGASGPGESKGEGAMLDNVRPRESAKSSHLSPLPVPPHVNTPGQ